MSALYRYDAPGLAFDGLWSRGSLYYLATRHAVSGIYAEQCFKPVGFSVEDYLGLNDPVYELIRRVDKKLSGAGLDDPFGFPTEAKSLRALREDLVRDFTGCAR